MEDQRHRLWRLLFFALVGVILLVLAYQEYQRGFLGPSKVGNALSQCDSLVRVCHHFRAKPESDGKFPAKLSDLLAPPWGGVALIDGGKSTILDPWDNEFRYCLVETDTGPMPYVWCEREYDGKLRVFGARLTADGKAMRFGWPD